MDDVWGEAVDVKGMGRDSFSERDRGSLVYRERASMLMPSLSYASCVTSVTVGYDVLASE